jgi:N-acetylmuramoyl-L-alanine amidase CwlA
MAILRPDTSTTLNGVKINEYLLTKHNPNRIDMPSVSMEGKVIGVTVHNTDWISVASRTTPAEQYTRATVNGNMKDVRVHYYVDNTCAWQNLPHSLSGWHAADGSGNGNRRTIAIECIMSSAYNVTDKKSEDNCARLAAALLKKYNLDINHLFTHTHWLNVRNGKSDTMNYLNTARNPYKMCPLYILPHWSAFKSKVQSYMKSGTSISKNPTTKLLYRVRKS